MGIVPNPYDPTQVGSPSWKQAAESAETSTNINLSSPGATIGGAVIPPGQNKLVLLGAQTNPAENGLYVFDTPTTPLIRSIIANTGEKIDNGAVVIDNGTNERKIFTLDIDGTETIDFDPVVVTEQGGVGNDELVKVSSNDLSSDFLLNKLSAGTDISITELNDGGNETVQISSTASTTDELAKVSSNDTTADFLTNKIVAGSNITINELNDGSNETLQIIANISPNTDENVKVSSNDTTSDFLLNKLVAGNNIDITENNDGGNETVTIDVETLTKTDVSDFVESDYVHTFGAESIAGVKTFTDELNINLGGVESFNFGTNGNGDGLYKIYDRTGSTGESLEFVSRPTRASIIVQGSTRLLEHVAINHQFSIVGNTSSDTLFIKNSDNDGIFLAEGDGRLRATFPSYTSLVDANNVLTNKEYVDNAITTAVTGLGDVSGLGSSTDNALTRWNGTSGTSIQNSGVILDDANNLSGINNLDVNGLTRVGTNFASPYKLSVQSNTNFTYIEILNDGGFNQGAFFGIENNGPLNSDQDFTLYNWQGGPITFYTDTVPSSGQVRFQIENDGTLNVAGQTNYELKVTDDDDIPNKRYVDDADATVLSLANRQVRVSGADTTSSFLSSKLSAGTNIGFNILNPGLNEQLQLNVTGLTKSDITDFVEGDYVHTFGNESIAGVKTFTEDVPIIIDSPSTGGSLEIGYFNSVLPNCYGVRNTTASGYFCFMPNASNPQIVMGDPNNTTGSGFIDVDNNRPLNLNVLDTGAGTPAVVNIGSGGLNIIAGGNITLGASNTVDGVDVGSPKNSIVVDTNQYQLVNDSASPGANKRYGTNSSGVKGWVDNRSPVYVSVNGLDFIFGLTPSPDYFLAAIPQVIFDPVNGSMRVLAYDDTINEGAGYFITIPPDALTVKIRIVCRATGALTGTDNVNWKIAFREFNDGTPISAWSDNDLGTFGISNNDWKYNETGTLTLASLGLNQGSLYHFQLYRNNTGVTDNIVGDVNLVHVRFEIN